MAPQFGVLPTGHDVWSKVGNPVGAGVLEAIDDTDAALLEDWTIGAVDEEDDA